MSVRPSSALPLGSLQQLKLAVCFAASSVSRRAAPRRVVSCPVHSTSQQRCNRPNYYRRVIGWPSAAVVVAASDLLSSSPRLCAPSYSSSSSSSSRIASSATSTFASSSRLLSRRRVRSMRLLAVTRPFHSCVCAHQLIARNRWTA